MLAAGLLAKKAVERGPDGRSRCVKTSLAPGSRVVTDYLDAGRPAAVPRAARLPHRRLRLHDLHRQQRPAARADRRGRSTSDDLVVRRRALAATATSRAASTRTSRPTTWPRPPLVVAYALAGTRRHRPDDRAARHGPGRQAGLPRATSGRRAEEIQATDRAAPSTPELFRETLRQRLRRRRALAARCRCPTGDLYAWDATSHLHRSAAVLRRT